MIQTDSLKLPKITVLAKGKLSLFIFRQGIKIITEIIIIRIII